MTWSMLGAALVGLVVQGAFHYYLWRRLVRDTALRAPWRRVATIAITIGWLAIPSTMWLNRAGVAWIGPTLGWVAFPWMALVALTCGLLVAVDVARLIGRVVGRARGRARPEVDAGRRAALARMTGGVALAAGGGAVGVGIRQALGDHEIRTVEVPIAGLDRALDGYAIAQITDLHVGMTIGRGFVDDLVARVNAMDADLIAVTGDMVDGTVADLGDQVAPLAGLRARDGVYFVTGNHEYYAGVEPWLVEFARLGFRHLRNQHVVIRGGLTLAGVDDHTAGRFGPSHGPRYDAALAGRDPALPVVLLAHQPRQIVHAIRHRVALQLSGHTHGGQVWPWHYIVALQQGGRVAGLYHEQGTTLYVCRGAGYWGPPVRIGAAPEIGRIVLRAA